MNRNRQRERTRRKEARETPEVMLRNLLAIVHRDGGHYTETVGLAASCRQAMDVVSGLVQRVDEESCKDEPVGF